MNIRYGNTMESKAFNTWTFKNALYPTNIEMTKAQNKTVATIPNFP